MKRISYILSTWILCSSFTPLDFFKEWYNYHYTPYEIAPFAIPNAVGNGVADDTAAIQTWLDSGSTATPNGNETYLISSQLDIDQNGLQVVDFNGATVTTNTSINYMFVPNKLDGAETSIRNVEIDGNDTAYEAISWLSWGTGHNIHIHHMYRDGGNAIGMRFRVTSSTKSHGDYLFTDCDFNNIKAEYNGVIGDGDGAARAVIITYDHNQSGTTMTFNGGTWHDVWGDDGDIIQVADNDQTNPSTLMTRFIGITMYNANRRYGKFTGANIEVIACDVQTTLASNPEAQATTASYLFEFGMVGDGSSVVGYGHKLINNTIDMTGANSGMARFAAVKTEDFIINGNTLTNLNIDLNKYISSWSVSGVEIINNTCTNVTALSNGGYGTDVIGVGNNTGLTNSLNATEGFTIAAPDPLITCNDGIQNQGETGVDTGGPCSGTPPPAPTCNDGIQNGDETGVDCGGSCDPCAVSATGSGVLISRRRAY